MDMIEYRKELEALTSQFELDKKRLAVRYALSNNPYKVGDVVTDHIGSINIEKITVSSPFMSDEPSCVYHGLELKKDGTPKKSMEKRSVYQNNIIVVATK